MVSVVSEDLKEKILNNLPHLLKEKSKASTNHLM